RVHFLSKRLAREIVLHSDMSEIHARMILRRMQQEDGKEDPTEEGKRDEQRSILAVQKSTLAQLLPFQLHDSLYNVSSFTLESIRRIDTFGWRKMTEIDKYTILAY
ncbi:hypothetical protein CPC16_005166, partial [Podila verticillata]